jgi:small subunit ribosomal protein S6
MFCLLQKPSRLANPGNDIAAITYSPLPAPSRTLTTMGEVILPQTKTDRNYETVYIVRANLDEDAVDKTVAGVEEYMKGLGVTVVSTEKKGRRRLAYEVDKMRDGYYVFTVFKAKAEAIAQIKRMMTLSEDIIRSLIVIQEKTGSTIS